MSDRGRAIITAWSTSSPFGLDNAAFERGVRAGESAGTGLSAPDFDPREILGRKGTSAMDRASALAVYTVGQLLDGQRIGSNIGVVLGTTSGSAQTQVDFARASLLRRKPYFVEPAMMPFGLMNSAAAQSALWHRLTGPNTTLAGGRIAGLSALGYAARLLAADRAEAVVCGGVEELTPARSRLDQGNREPNDIPLGEGCAVLLLAAPGSCQAPLADLLAVDTRVCLDADDLASLTATMTTSLRTALHTAGVGPEDVWAVAPSEAPGTLGQAENAAIAEVFGNQGHARVAPGCLIGDTGSATISFQLAALLSLQPSVHGLAVVTAVEDGGMIGSALVHLR